MAFDEPMHSDLQKIVDNINKVMAWEYKRYCDDYSLCCEFGARGMCC
ncbi:hypothetical protein BSAF29S_05963 [Bacillus safensis subsp. safensis]